MEHDANEELAAAAVANPEQQKPLQASPATATANANTVGSLDAAVVKAEHRRQRQKVRRAAARAQLEATRHAKAQRKAELEQRQAAATQEVESLKARLEVVEQEKHRLVGQLRQVLQAEGLQRRPSVMTLGGPGDMGQSLFSPMAMQQQLQLHPQQLGGAPLRTTSTGFAMAPQVSGAVEEAAAAAATAPAGQLPHAPQVSPFGSSGFVTAGPYGSFSTAPGPGQSSDVAGSSAARSGATTAGVRHVRTVADEEDEGEIREDGEYGAAGPGHATAGGHPSAAGHPSGPTHAAFSVAGPGMGAGIPAPLTVSGLGSSASPAAMSGTLHAAGSSHGPSIHGLGHGAGAAHGLGALGHGPSLGHGGGFGAAGAAGAAGPSIGAGAAGHGHGGPGSGAFPDPLRRSVGGAMFPETRPSALQPQQPQMSIGMQGPSGVGPGPGPQMQMRIGQGGRGGGWGSGPNPGFGVQGGLHPHHGLGPPMGRGGGAFGGRMPGGSWRDEEMMSDGMSYGGYGRGRGMSGFPIQGPPRRNW
ncbi:hypothetical protein Vafri_565 [Volvox africanus]|nr:hypothetical protein Vafri_565 [Volvox africanus]